MKLLIIGPVELDINTLQSGAKRRVVSIDLGSVYKTKDGDPVYWLEKADVMQRNKWEIIIVLEFSSGLSGNVTSKPFRVTTKAGYKTKHNSGLCWSYLTDIDLISNRKLRQDSAINCCIKPSKTACYLFLKYQ